jgi:hypothetical protein
VFDNLTENVNFYQNEVYFADGNYFYTFTENEQFTFIYSDDAGNSDSVTASVDWIDKKAPTMEVAYSEESLTNQDVVVTFTGSDPDDGIWAVSGVDNLTWSRVSIAEENVTFEDKGDGVYTLTFSDNGTVDVVLTDKAGNETEQEININWIDKDAPIADVEYSTQGSTSGNVDVTISVRDLHAATISNVDQLPEYIQEDASNNYEYSKFPEYKYTFTQNGSYTFEVCDEAGNITTVPVVVTNIDRELPEVELYYSTEESTPYYVTAYLRTKESVKINGINEDSRWIIDKDGNYLYSQLEHTFIQNGEYVFEFTDSVGNRGAATAKVDWIENRPPEVSVRYSTQYFTNDEVEARLVLENDYNKGFKITNNDGSDTYTFTENGSFTFQYENDYGAKGEIMAEVDLIDRTPPVMDSIEYRPGGSTPKPYRHGTTIRILGHDDNSGMDSVADRWHWITENGDYVFEIEDRAGNKTEVPVEIDWIDKIPPEVTYSGNLDTMTNDDVIITLSSNEKVVIYNAYMPYDRSFHLEVESPDTLLKERTAILKKNGIYRFTFLDEAWNESGVIEVEVTNIDRVAPALTVSGEADMVIESKDEDKIMEFLKEGMSAVDDREGDITDNIQYEEVSTELRDNGDLVKVYECSVEDRAGNKSQTLTREVVISESYLPTVYIDGEVAGERITRTVGEGETHCIVPIAFTGFTGEYTVKMVSGEKPPAHFKSYFSSDIIYNSRFSSGRMKPLVLGPGVYTVYGYDMEMGYISIVIEINGGV